MSSVRTVHVPHLGGIDAAYQMPQAYDAAKPTLVLVNSLTTSSELYRPQFEDAQLTGALNLLAIDPLGHGQTRTKSETWTFWDTAIMNLQVMEALGIQKAFALGTSQGGFIVVRMALLSPDKVCYPFLKIAFICIIITLCGSSWADTSNVGMQILGVIPLGTSMDYESPRTRDLGCWNGYDLGIQFVSAWKAAPTSSQDDFYVGDDYAGAVSVLGFGPSCPPEVRDFWTSHLRKSYAGEEGRNRVRMAVLNVAERDGLLGKLEFVRCPVLWMQGTEDKVFSVANAREEIKMFTGVKGSYGAQLKEVDGGHHFLSATNPDEVKKEVLEFVSQVK